MSHLMSQGKHIVKIILIVHEHERMAAVGSPGISAASLTLILIDVNPAAVHTFRKHLNIFFSQRLQSFFDYFFCFLKRNLHADLIHHRRIKVIHVKLIHAQRFFAKRHIAVHQRQTLMYSVNELCIYRNRNLASVKSHGKR